MPPEHDELIPLEKHTTFYAVAYTSLLQAREQQAGWMRTLAAAKLAGPLLSEDALDTVAVAQAAEERAAVTAVVFSALALEAFINDYAITRLSKSYFSKYLDKLDPAAKCVVIPRLHTGKEFDTDTQAFERLRKLFSLRNRLVHFKSTKKRVSELTPDDQVSYEHAEEAIEAVRSVVAALATLDPSVGTDWVRDAEKVPGL